MYCNWLKRMMVVLFALGLVFGVASDALAECEHSLTKKGEIEYRWQYYDEKYHWELRRIQILCYYCGQFLQYDDIYGYFEDHTPGSNGKCTKCGSSTSTECTHSRTYWSKTANVTRSWRDEGTETQHKVYDEYSRFCENCGYYFESEERNFRWENHYFRDDGSCGGCGYQKSTACTHVNTETTTVKTEYEPISGNDKQHQVIRHTKVVCASCGKDMGAEDVEYSTAAHSFGSNNKCTSCGYQKSTECQHTNTSKTTVKTEYEPISGNEKQHRVIKHNKVSCSTCGKVLKENEVEYWVGSHSFNSNGHCSSCGYKKADCVHANTSKKYITDAEYINVDAEQHYKIRYYNLICSKCKEVVEENVRGEELQKHSLDNLGACRYCEYSDIAKCKHWHTTDTVIVKQNYKKWDQREHKVEGLGTVTCDDCHVVIEENVEVYTYEYHNFDRNAACLYCGYQIKINEDRSLGVSSTHTFYVSKEGESNTYRMNGILVLEWTVHSTVDWISLSTSGGKHGDSLTYTVAANEGEDRCGNIIIEHQYAGIATIFIIQEGSREATVKMHPTLTGFSVTPTTVNLGDSITVSGIVSGNGAKLTAVSVGVRNYSNQDLGGYWGHQTSLYDDTFDLSSFGPITLSGELGNTDFESGQWIVEVYATTEDGLGFATSHSQIITINNNEPECKHADTQQVSTGEVNYQLENETYHTVNLGYNEVCLNCNAIVDHTYVTSIETHNFVESDQCNCGYINENKPDEYYLTVDRGHISGLIADVTGGQGATINVSGNVAWTVSEDLNWVTVHNFTGNGNGSFTVYVEANAGYAREGYITVYGAPCEPISIRITQEGAIVDSTTCEHVYGYDYADVSDGEWQSVNDDFHKRVTVLFKDVCTLCGDVRYERRADEASVQEKHTWGKTKWKEFKKRNEDEHYRTGMTSCTALGCNATKNVVETGMHEYEDTIRAEKNIYIDESYHQLVTTYYKQCDCGATISSEVPSEYLAAHVYNGDTGECLAVGCTSVFKDDPTEMCEHRWGASWVCNKCNLRKENAEELWGMQKQLTEAITQPYYSDRLNAEGDHDAVSGFELAVMELLAKGIVGTAEHEIEQGIRNADAGIDNGRDIVHKMVYDEVFKIEKKWNTFVKEMSSLSNDIRENFTTEKAQAIYLLSQIDDSEYIILLDGDQNDWAKNPKLKSLWMLLGDEALRNYSQMDEYRRSSKSLGAQSLNILGEAGKWASKIGKGINLMNTGANYILEYLYKDELNATIDKWIAATDDDNFKAEMEDYKDVYNSEVGAIISTFTDSGFASSELKDIGTLMANKGLFGSGVKNVVGKLGKSAFAKVISQADTVLMVNQLLYKYIIDIDIDSMYTSISNLQTVDDLYRGQVETIEAFSRSGASYADYENELRLAAALSKLECQYYLAILDNNMLGLSEEEKSQMGEIRADYANYITAIDTYLEEYLDALQDARDASLFIH